MFTGIISTKHILTHPFLIIRIKGVRGFLKMVKKALSRKQYRFVECLENTAEHFVGIPRAKRANRIR